MTGALIALALVAYIALHEWFDTLIDIETEERFGIAALVLAVGLIGGLVEQMIRALWSWLV